MRLPRNVIRALTEGSRLAGNGQDYERASLVLRAGLARASRYEIPTAIEEQTLVAQGWDSLGHVTRELGAYGNWAASFHLRASRMWQTAGEPHSAGMSLLSAAHCIQRHSASAAFELTNLANTIKPPPATADTLEMSIETRRAEIYRTSGDILFAARIYSDRVVPTIRWNAVHVEWGAISLIAASTVAWRSGRLDACYDLLRDVQENYCDGVARNRIIECDLLGTEIGLFVTAGEIISVEQRWNRLQAICLRNGYAVKNYIAFDVIAGVLR